MTNIESNGLIVRGSRGRTVSSTPRRSQDSIGRFGFLAVGFETVANPSWNMLWNQIQQMAPNVGLIPELILFDPDHPQQALDGPLTNGRRPPVIILTSPFEGPIKEQVLRFRDSLLVSVDEHHSPFLDNVVVLDHYQVGWAAAECLTRAGYRRLALLGRHLRDEYRPITLCALGFHDGVKAAGLTYSKSDEFWSLSATPVELIEQIKALTTRITDSGYDGIFLQDPEHLDLIYDLLQRRAAIPDNFGLVAQVTPITAETARQHVPKISAVSLSANAFVNVLIREIMRFFRTGERKLGHIRVPPVLYTGATLRPLSGQLPMTGKGRRSRVSAAVPCITSAI